MELGPSRGLPRPAVVITVVAYAPAHAVRVLAGWRPSCAVSVDKGGPDLLAGDAVTVEPGLYCKAIGRVRVKDMVVVTRDGSRNLNQLPEGLDWR